MAGIEVVVDENLIEQAEQLTGEHDRQQLIDQALREMIRRRSKLKSLFDLVGKVEFYEGYDYKALRFSRYDSV